MLEERLHNNPNKAVRCAILQALGQAYLEQGDYRRALACQRQYLAANKEMLEQRSAQNITALTKTFQAEMECKKAALEKMDRRIRRITAQALASGMLLLPLLSLLLYSLLRNRKRSRQQIAALASQLLATQQKITAIARNDSLTSLLNHNAISEIINYEKTRFERTFRQFSLILLDIDHFQQINEKHGLNCGNSVLTQMAHFLKTTLRKQDGIGRLQGENCESSTASSHWAGDEFLLFLPETTAPGVRVAAEKLQAQLRGYSFRINGETMQLTATLGVSTYAPGESASNCLHRANQALFRGKNQGRNQVVLAEPPV